MKKMIKHNKLRVIILIAAVLLLLTGCSGVKLKEKRYYLLSYVELGERQELVEEEPFPYTILIEDARVAQTYTRKQIVKRHYSPLMQYMSNDLWAIRLSDAIPDIVAQRVQYYNAFQNVWRNTPVANPDYQLSIDINNLEMYENQKDLVSDARLSMKFTMYKMQESNTKIPDLHVEYSFDRKIRIPPNDMQYFVQEINRMILEETSNFMAETLNELKGTQYKGQEEIAERDSTYSVIDYSQHAIGDTSRVRDKQTGLLYLPNLSGETNEPYYTIYTMNNKEVEQGQFGFETSLDIGQYIVRYGDGGLDQQMEQKVKILPYWRKSVQPDWGCLIVNVIDEQRNYVKVSYNLFDNEDGYDYGIEYPGDETLGEKQRVWILKPGTYKITINSESYNTYRDFTTIEVKENECQRLTLVVEEDETTGLISLIGAGTLNEDELITDSNWNINSAIHVNINMTSDNETDKNDSEFSVDMSSQLDNTLTYQLGRLTYTGKNLVEVGTSKDEGYEEFRVDLDDFDLKNTVILNVISSIGLYGRFDLNTHLFPSYEYDLSYMQIDAEGDTLFGENVHRYASSPSIFPLTLKEGLGINFQFLDTSRADMNLRAGLGMRQDIRNDVFSTSGTQTYNGVTYELFTEDESVNYEGIEASLVGDLQIMQNLNYSLTADILFPFGDMENYTMDMENIFNFKLFRYVSIDYRLKFFSRESDGKLDYIANQQSVFLRFTYILR